MNKPFFSHSKLLDKIKFLEAMRDLDPNMPASQMLFLLYTAQMPDSSVRQIAQAANVPHASASRYLTSLSDGRPAIGQEGLGVLEQTENPLDRKFKIVSLSDKGKELLSMII